MKADYSKEILASIVAESKSYRAVLAALGKVAGGGAWSWLKKKIVEYDLDTSHFYCNYQDRVRFNTKKKEFDEVLIKHPRKYRIRTYQLRRALFESGRVYLCGVCGLGPEWNSKKLVLEIDHIDGDWSNCVSDNLMFVCPNCHSQKPLECDGSTQR